MFFLWNYGKTQDGNNRSYGLRTIALSKAHENARHDRVETKEDNSKRFTHA